MAALVAIVLMTQGVVQTLSASASVAGIQGFEQMIARGPVASQIAIKQLGTNGGGFFNVNSAHPFENATPISNFVETFAILWIAAALTYTFGKMVGSVRQGWVIFAVMWVLMVAGLVLTVPGEHTATPAMQAAGISASAPNLEGQGGPDRPRRVVAVGGDHHRRLQRQRELDARLVPAARRSGADVQHRRSAR